MTELQYINRAIENAFGLAMTGRYGDVLAIEEHLSVDNPYARQALGQGFLRAHLQELCEKARMDEERHRRAAFGQWVRGMAHRVPEHIPPGLRAEFRAKATTGRYKRPALRLEHAAYTIEVVRFFMTPQLHVQYLFQGPDTPIYSIGAKHMGTVLFTDITPEELAEAVREGHEEACRTAYRLLNQDAPQRPVGSEG